MSPTAAKKSNLKRPGRKRLNPLQRVILLPVYFYKKCISPFLPRSCIYYPSCSTYMVQAIKEYGAIRGVYLGVRRLLRCVPWKEGGYDPVPENPKGEMKWLF